jgi:hypothetical protein
MKTMITSLLALTLGLGNASATDSNAVAPKKANTTQATVSVVAYQQVLEENMTLRNKLEAMANENAELSSKLQYGHMMGNLLSTVSVANQTEKLADLQSQLAYDQMMANLNSKLEEEKAADAAADQQGWNNYNHMMANLMAKMGAQKTADEQADQQAMESYNKMMANMVLKLKQDKR